VNFDDLRQRERERHHRRLAAVAVGASDRAAVYLSDEHEVRDWVSREELQKLDLIPETTESWDCVLSTP
jgi:hypothetical protein